MSLCLKENHAAKAMSILDFLFLGWEDDKTLYQLLLFLFYMKFIYA